MKVWWFHIELAQRGYQRSQRLPKGVALGFLAGVASAWCGNHHTCTLAPWPEIPELRSRSTN